jgi:hypothetical protein
MYLLHCRSVPSRLALPTIPAVGRQHTGAGIYSSTRITRGSFVSLCPCSRYSGLVRLLLSTAERRKNRTCMAGVTCLSVEDCWTEFYFLQWKVIQRVRDLGSALVMKQQIAEKSIVHFFYVR